MDINVENRIKLFRSGDEKKAYEWLGVHREDATLRFRVWAPGADAVFLVGDFNSWQESCPMDRVGDGGIWEACVSADSAKPCSAYKYKLYRGGNAVYKADPYCRRMEAPPYSNSLITEEDGFVWNDGGWLEQRAETCESGYYAQPMNIYEVHLGSWKRKDTGELYNYRELADELAPYLKQMGYTHVELLPVAEHPFGGSWGYQVGGFYAPTSRYGSANDLMSFVDTMHRAGIGVILDWVPGHFPKDEFGIYEFDGTHLYEYAEDDRREINGWGTARFDLRRGEVVSFLISNAVYWFEKYHVDGLRADAVSSMLYLDYDRKEGEWTPNEYGDNRCLEAIDFFKKLNSAIKELYPDVLMIAEESSAWQGVTSPDGLGFDLKWNMGWMNDTLSYACTELKNRAEKHGKITFPLMYAFDERFILPISHDEVIHGKKSFLDKMPGDYWRKFAGARAFEVYKMTMPGKKLTFMGCEIAQFREWSSEQGIEWFLLDYESHARHQLFCSDLNNLYLSHPELWQVDDGWEGFKWIEPDDSERSIISFRRIAENGRELIIAINFTAKTYNDYFLPVTEDGEYEELFNSDDLRYGGSGVTNKGASLVSRPNPNLTPGLPAEKLFSRGIRLRLPPLGAVIVKLKKRRFGEDEEETK